jgi:prevent-host-death family protein
MKTRKTFRVPPASMEPSATHQETELIVNVRAAKDRLSSLLDQAARGTVVVITSNGVPKAKLVPVRSKRPPFRVDWKLLRSTPPKRGVPTVEEIVRADRDGRA